MEGLLIGMTCQVPYHPTKSIKMLTKTTVVKTLYIPKNTQAKIIVTMLELLKITIISLWPTII